MMGRDKSKASDDLGFWSVNYQVGRNGKGDKRFRTKVDVDGKRIGFQLSAGIPEMTVEMFEGIREAIEAGFGDMEGLDSSSPADHAAVLRKVANYCNALADKLTQ